MKHSVKHYMDSTTDKSLTVMVMEGERGMEDSLRHIVWQGNIADVPAEYQGRLCQAEWSTARNLWCLCI